MDKKITIKELNGLKNLLATQDYMIYRFEQFSKQIKEPQLKIELQKMYAMIQNHKIKLLSVLGEKAQ